MYKLKDEELKAFREDVRETERDIQKYIGIYMSGLILVAGWIVGPQTKPLLKMALDNEGYNIYSVFVVVSLNVIFTCFLIYKSLRVHEAMQFVTYYSDGENGFTHWEIWRRERYSGSKRVRPFYSVMLSLLPICVSFLVMYGSWRVIQIDPKILAAKINKIEAQASDPSKPLLLSADPNQLSSVLKTAKIWFWIVALFHFIPILFFYESLFPASKRWNVINSLKISSVSYDDLDRESDRLSFKRRVRSWPGNVKAKTGIVLVTLNNGIKSGYQVLRKYLSFLKGK